MSTPGSDGMGRAPCAGDGGGAGAEVVSGGVVSGGVVSDGGVVSAGVATAGGTWPGLGAAVAADLLANWYFTPPLYTFSIGHSDHVLALVVFLAVAAVVSWLVGYAARRTAEAYRQ